LYTGYMKKVINYIGKLFLVAVIVLIISIYSNLKDRNKGYKIDMKIIASSEAPLMAGFAAVAITPEVPDRWTDTDNDAIYRPRKGDTFSDGNGNGKFDPVWIAGFGQGRAANGIHDDLWARTMIIDDGKTRLAIVALDAIGLMNNEIIDIRKQIPENAGITYTVVISTHTHEAPDLIGLWGKAYLRSGINKDYTEYVKKQVVRSIETAVANMRPARLEISEDPEGPGYIVKDTREPQVFDSGVRVIRVVDRESGSTLGTMVSWADHPETLWDRNLLISSDFPHYVREFIEKGFPRGDSIIMQGTGGICLYVNGAIGGLMTTYPSLPVTDPATGEEFMVPSFGKAEAQGKQIAMVALRALQKPSIMIEKAGISLIARTIILPIKNPLFRLASALGILDRGTVGWMKMRSEIAVFSIGPLSFVTFPGEVYPEIVNGGIEAPEGQDFTLTPVEVPPVREMMKGKIKFVFGLANDEIGYIIPKSQWDIRQPFAYGREKAQYGEMNSLGPETGPILHSALKEMLEQM
ncbi:MAG: hypothetical protein ACUVTX_09945, partial [Bacteroidales bacterium]